MVNKALQRIDFLKKYLKKVDFSNLSILDAGTGKDSSRVLSDLKPKKLCCVTFIGDTRKGNTVKKILAEARNKNYELLYGDLENSKLFKNNSFDFILADYLLGEVDIDKVKPILANLFRWLKPGGKLFLMDREFSRVYKPKIKYVSMGELIGSAEINKRSNRDLVDMPDFFLQIAKSISFLIFSEKSFDYLSSWASSWLKEAGFHNIKFGNFYNSVNLNKEFFQRLGWAKERISSLKNKDLKKGLLSELSKVEEEFNARKVKETENFLRKNYYFAVQK